MKDPNTPTGGNDKGKSGLVGLTDKKESEISTALQKDKDYSSKEKLIGDTDAILNDLKENHVKTEDAEIMGYKGKKVHIDLPAVGDFEGFKFDYFVSDEEVMKKDFERNHELEMKSYSMGDVSDLLNAMNKYMTELQGDNDGEASWAYYIARERDNTIGSCKAGDCIKNITGLDGSYWLKDTYENARYRWDLSRCYFGLTCNYWNEEKLFLKLPD